jgi:WD40 repeat protein
MKLVEGGSLAQHLAAYTADPRAAAQLVATVARAVHHAHERGILHRDLKPSNIVIDAAGQPHVTDFGLAKRVDGDSQLTQSGAILGTPSYMAPEQALGERGRIGTATDIYGLGAVLYALFTGRPPFQGDSVLETIEQVKKGEPEPPSGVNRRVDRDLQTICLKCLDKDPARRYASARALADDLERFLAGEPILARRPRLWEKARRQVRRHPMALVVVALLALFAVTLLETRSWLESRLAARRAPGARLQDVARERAQTARRAQYPADIRLAHRLVQDNRPRDADELLVRYRARPGDEDLRDFAWYHLWHRTHSERRTLTGHQGDVYYVEFSPRGDLLASTGKDGTVLIWDASRWQLVRKIVAAKTEVNVAAFSPDGNTIATVDDDGMLKLWETAAGHCLMEKLAHKGDAVVARFTKDGKKILTGGRKDGTVKIWNRSSGVMLDSFKASDYEVENAAFSVDGSVLAMVGQEGVKLWKWPSKTPIARLEGPGTVEGVAFSHGGRMLATANHGGRTLKLWEVPGGRELRELRGHTLGVFSVAFSADDRAIVSAGEDETIRVWDVSTGAVKAIYEGRSGKVWNLALSHDGRTIASCAADGTVKLWDVEPARYGLALPTESPWGFGFAPDSRSLMVFELAPQWAVSRWDIRSGALIERKRLNLAGLKAGHLAAFSHNGRLLALPSESGTITLYDLTTGHYQTIGDPAFGILMGVEFSPDDRFLKFHRPSPKPELVLWDTESHRLIESPWYAPGKNACWTQSPAVVTGLGVGRLGWWNPATGQSKTLWFVPALPFTDSTVAADGRVIAAWATGSGPRIQLWSTATRRLDRECAGHRGGVWGLAFAPDGKTLASAGVDGTIKLWDVATAGELLTLEGFGGEGWYPRFSPDGKALAGFGQKTAAARPLEIRLWLAAENEPALE